MKYNNRTYKSRQKYLGRQTLSPDEQSIIEKDFQGKDFAYFESIREKTLLLSENYSSKSTYLKIESSIHKHSIFTKGMIYTASSIAAILVLAILSVFIYQPQSYHPTITVISTTYGEHKDVLLPDGSTVTLNSLSSISYPQNLEGESRVVELKGEAYFDVAKDPQKPFVVQLAGLDIKVLGTKFNIQAYENENNICTSLFEGSVSVNISNGDNYELKAGSKAIFNKDLGNLEVMTLSDINNDIYWVNDILRFDNQSLTDILKTLERENNTVFHLNDTNLGKLKMTAQFKENESIEQILDILGQLLGFSYSRQGNIYLIKKAN